MLVPIFLARGAYLSACTRASGKTKKEICAYEKVCAYKRLTTRVYGMLDVHVHVATD